MERKNEITPLEIYKQHYAHFGRMNDIIYKLPILYATLIGGLWYFGISISDEKPIISSMVVLFAALLCWASVIMTRRLKMAMNGYLNSVNSFDAEYAVSLKNADGTSASMSTLTAIEILLWGAVILSTIAAFTVSWTSLNGAFLYFSAACN